MLTLLNSFCKKGSRKEIIICKLTKPLKSPTFMLRLHHLKITKIRKMI